MAWSYSHLEIDVLSPDTVAWSRMFGAKSQPKGAFAAQSSHVHDNYNHVVNTDLVLFGGRPMLCSSRSAPSGSIMGYIAGVLRYAGEDMPQPTWEHILNSNQGVYLEVERDPLALLLRTVEWASYDHVEPNVIVDVAAHVDIINPSTFGVRLLVIAARDLQVGEQLIYMDEGNEYV